MRIFRLFLCLVIISIAAHAQPALSAGAARADLTPPPGFPTGGHGPAGEIARGYWTRLHARAFYFRDPHGASLVLVSCDLFAIPLALHTEVWKRIAPEARAGLHPKDIIISATHTHQGPGNYLTAEVYNQFGSKYSGFSRPLFEFLAARIASAISEAFTHRQPAQLNLHSGQVREQFVINRSPLPFMLNWDRRSVLDELGADLPDEICEASRLPGEPVAGWDLEGCPRLRAVDRRMTILEVLAGGRRTAALVFFAVHPTVLEASTPLYSSDFTGLALDELEREGNPGAVIGFFNGGEGDVTARRTTRDILEARTRATQFRDAIRAVLTQPAHPLEPRILVRAKLIDASSEKNRTCTWGSYRASLAERPVFGAAALGGAEFDRTSLYELGWHEGRRDRAEDGQGPKLPGLDDNILHLIKLTHWLAPARHFPRLLPITWVEIGEFALGALPVEMSTTQALRLRHDLESPSRYFQLIGLANEYGSYVATASEYAAQDYMGASTVWGPHEGEFYTCSLDRLAAAADPGLDFAIPRAAYHPGSAPHPAFGPTFTGDRRDLPDEQLDEILRNRRGEPERHLPFFDWTEEAHTRDQEFAAAGERQPIRIIDAHSCAVIDEREEDFIKVLAQAPDHGGSNQRLWSAIWIAPLWTAPESEYRFVIGFKSKPLIESEPFRVDLGSAAQPKAVTPAKTPCISPGQIPKDIL